MSAGKFSKIKFGDGLAVTDEGGGVIRVDGGGGGGGGSGVPAGGTVGQALTKQSGTDYATVWSLRVTFPPDGTGGDVVFGGDTGLYRSGAGAIKNDGYLVAGQAVLAQHGTATQIYLGDLGDGLAAVVFGSDNAVSLRRTGPDLVLYAGKLWLGSSVDTNLYRAAGRVVATDGGFATPAGAALAMAGGAVTITRGLHSITSVTGGTNLTAINGGSDGMLLTLINRTASALTIASGGNLFPPSSPSWPVNTARQFVFDVVYACWQAIG